MHANLPCALHNQGEIECMHRDGARLPNQCGPSERGDCALEQERPEYTPGDKYSLAECPTFEELFVDLSQCFEGYFMATVARNEALKNNFRRATQKKASEFRLRMGVDSERFMGEFCLAVEQLTEALLMGEEFLDKNADKTRSAAKLVELYFRQMLHHMSTSRTRSGNLLFQGKDMYATVMDRAAEYLGGLLSLGNALLTREGESELGFCAASDQVKDSARLFGKYLDQIGLEPRDPDPTGITHADLGHLGLETHASELDAVSGASGYDFEGEDQDPYWQPDSRARIKQRTVRGAPVGAEWSKRRQVVVLPYSTTDGAPGMPRRALERQVRVLRLAYTRSPIAPSRMGGMNPLDLASFRGAQFSAPIDKMNLFAYGAMAGSVEVAALEWQRAVIPRAGNARGMALYRAKMQQLQMQVFGDKVSMMVAFKGPNSSENAEFQFADPADLPGGPGWFASGDRALVDDKGDLFRLFFSMEQRGVSWYIGHVYVY